MDISEFKKKNKRKKVSVLKKFEAEILELYHDNYSLKSITQFLEDNGVKTTFQNVSQFIKSIDRNNLSLPKKDEIDALAPIANKRTIMPKLEKIGKDLDLKDAPDWAN